MVDKSDLKVAIVCDWLVNVGGAERVLLQLHKLFPKAPIFTSQYDPAGIDWFKNADVRTGWLQHLPVGLRKFLPPLRAWYFSHLNLNDYDLVLSSSGAEAKAVKTNKSTLHICYMHAPTHYYWSRYDAYLANPGFGRFDPLARFGLKLLVGPLRYWDKRAAKRPDYLLTNSPHTQSMIKQYYGREASVIYPPVDIEWFKTKSKKQRHGYVTVGRQTPYKRIDLAVKACSRLNLPLTVIGDGPEHAKLVADAGPTIRFITGASDQDVANYLNSAEAFIFPSESEDFGITAIEAMAAGLPVIAFKGGGPLGFITSGKTGEFFTELSVESLASVLKDFNPETYERKIIKQTADQFAVPRFNKELSEYINDKIARFSQP